MSLGTPSMLFLLPAVALVGWLMRRSRRLQREAACRLKGVLVVDGRGRLSRGDWLTLAALVCVVAALTRPQWNPRPYDIEHRGRDLVIALDVSRSMLAADIFPNRMEMARIAILESLPALSGQRLALVTFAGSASVRVPLTLDHGFVRYMLERSDPSDMDLGSTSLQAAFEKVAEAVLTDAESGHRDLVVFTDGEDHLSDLKKTAELLAKYHARVLIIGLGDPVRGARVPDPVDDTKWMQHNNVEVVSRLEEDTLSELADACSKVTYFAARTRPFDLVPVYQRWVAEAGGDMVVGGLQQVRYTEGYPYLLALAVVLWLASSQVKLPKMGSLIVLALLLPGCARQAADESEAAFRARFSQGSQLQQFAQEQADVDIHAQRSLLVDAREEFLRAALLRPGDVETARRITTITRRLRALQEIVEEERAEEAQRHEKLAITIQKLEKLTARQKRLAERSRRALRTPPVANGEEANLPEPLDASANLSEDELEQLARPISKDQQTVREATSQVLEGVTIQRDMLRQILAQAYGTGENLPPTEVDPVVELLTETVDAQDQALENLAPDAIWLPRANTALHMAAGRMEQALEALRSLQPPKTDEDNETLASRNVGDVEAEMEGLDSELQDSGAPSVSPGDFQQALLLQSLPIPDYTSEEIMAEEAANQQKRARQKAARAGAKVEKNW